LNRRNLINLCLTLPALGLSGCGGLPLPDFAESPARILRIGAPLAPTDTSATQPVLPWFNRLAPLEVYDHAMISPAPLVDQAIIYAPQTIDPIARKVHVLPAPDNS